MNLGHSITGLLTIVLEARLQRVFSIVLLDLGAVVSIMVTTDMNCNAMIDVVIKFCEGDDFQRDISN